MVNLLQPREKFLVLELAPAGTNGLYLSVDEDRKITFERFVRNAPIERLLKTPVRRVTDKTWEGRRFFKGGRKVIVAADPRLATTIPIPLELQRERTFAKARITVAELENLIAQAMAKIFNGCRSEAAKRLGLNDLDTILVSAKAKHFKIDGKAAADPAGFPGKKVTLLLELTFTGRKLFEELKPLFNSSDHFFFAEAPQAHLASLARVRDLPLNLVVAEDDGASLFVFQKAKDDYAVLYREPLAWSARMLVSPIAEALRVSEAAAKNLYRIYRRGGVSESAARVFKKTLQPSFDAFLKEIARAKVSGPIYIDCEGGAPFETPYRHGGARIEEHPVGELLAELGFTADQEFFKEGGGGSLRSLIYFLEAYFDRSNSEINQKLRRRLHWLAA